MSHKDTDLLDVLIGIIIILAFSALAFYAGSKPLIKKPPQQSHSSTQ